jgi:putative transposase
MGWPLRIQAADVVYHITSRGVRRLNVYEDRIDYAKFEKLLAILVGKRYWVVHAFCLMPNHYHLVVNTPEADISDGMQWLNGIYARWFNDRHGYAGHVFDKRFHSTIVRGNFHLLNVACYVPLNPVRAKLCGRPDEWRWSSYRATVGAARKSWFDPSWLLAQFGTDALTARAEYARFVEAMATA